MSRRRVKHESGFAVLLVFAMAAAVAIMLFMQLPRVAFETQRNKEQLLIDRGEQYRMAIRRYYFAFKKYPAKIEDLENTNNMRFLRRRYVDPMTGKDEWRLIHVGAGGALTDSLVQKPPSLDGKDNTNQNQLAGSSGTGAQDANAVNPAVQRRASDRPLLPGAQVVQVDPNQPVDANGQPIYGPGLGPSPYQNTPGQPGYRGPGQPGQVGYPQPGQQVGYPVPGQQAGYPQPGQQPVGYVPQQYPGQSQPFPVQGGVTGVLGPQPGQFPQTGQPVPYGQPQAGQYGYQPGTGQPYQPGQQQNPNIYPGQIYTGQPGVVGPGYGTVPGSVPNSAAGGIVGGQVGGGPIGGIVGSSGPGFGSGAPSGPTAPNPALQMINRILTTPQQASSSPFGQVSGGGVAIAGVASKFEGPSIKRYKDREKYNEWEFIYDLKSDLGLMGQQGMQQGLQQGLPQQPVGPGIPQQPPRPGR